MVARILFGLCACFLLLLALSAGIAQPPASGPAATSPATESDEPVVGQMEHAGFGLVGSGGRHYVFGGLAVADYSWNNQQHIVTLQQEEPTLLARPDDDFLYYRELGTGHRWALGRHPLADDTYVVYFQPREGSTASKWTLFHRARLIWPEKQGEAAESHPQMTKGSCELRP